ncbi:MAG TPA: PAS domain-containing protein, partial [Herpetosiphonaceae bacterium]|nr:PAS domain-containing protein [Herpetosiphonaceae bacterium]
MKSVDDVVTAAVVGHPSRTTLTPEQTQAILDNSPVIVYVKDLQGRHLFVNRHFETLFGVHLQDIVGKTDHDLFNPEVADMLCANDRSVLEAGHCLEWEEVVPHRDGLPRTYISQKFPLCDAEGRIYALCGISTDITSRRQAEERTARLQAVTTSLGRALTREQVVAVIVEQGITAMGGYAGAVVLLSKDDTHFQLAGQVGYPDQLVQALQRPLAEAPPPITAVVQRQAPVLLDCREIAERYPDLAGACGESNAYVALLPLVVGDADGGDEAAVLGVLTLSFCHGHPLDDKERAFLAALAAQCAQALERARLYEAERQARTEAQKRAAELAAVIESIPDALFIADGHSVTLANAPALDLFNCDSINQLNQYLPAVVERARVRDASTGETLLAGRWPFRRALCGEENVVQDLLVYHPRLGRDVLMRCAASPIRVKGEVVGVITVSTDLMRSRQRTLIHNLFETQEEERWAVAYELHDGLAQYVMTAHAHLDTFDQLRQQALLTGNETVAVLLEAQLRQGLTSLKQAVIESRRLINGLRTLTLEDLGLAGALEQLLREEKERAGWEEAEFAHNIAECRYDRMLETAVYRVAQEALCNARKYARTSRVRVT